jgi:hypothetical protein
MNRYRLVIDGEGPLSFVDLMELRVSVKHHAECEPNSDHAKCRVDAHKNLCEAMKQAHEANSNDPT